MANTTDTVRPQGVFARQRAFTRVPFEHQVRWSYAPGEAGVAKVYDLSRGGLCVSMGRYLRPGRVLTLRFDDIHYKGEALEFDARIVWCDGVADGEGGFRTGLQVLHGKPVTLAKVSEVFYEAITRLTKQGYPCKQPVTQPLNSPSLAS